MPGHVPLAARSRPGPSVPRRIGSARAQPGEKALAGRYELLNEIGGGGMGVVFRGVDRVLERTVAVKLLHVDRHANDAVVRFEREARAAASLWHPNIVSVFDTGVDGATHFLVMEFVRGSSLAALLAEREMLDLATAVDIAAQISSGLAAAHDVGIVHRDIKPGNVMLEETGTVKLVDFGIARLELDGSLTRTGSVLGSAQYIAPEMVRGEPATDRSDVYSLGCVVYEALAGRPPFTGESAAAILHQHVHDQPSSLRDQKPEIPSKLDEVIMQMLHKRGGDRPSAAQLAVGLQRLDRLPSVERDPPKRARSPRVGRVAAAEPTRELTSRRSRPRRTIAAFVVALALLLAATLGAVEALSGHGSPEKSASGATLRHTSAARHARHPRSRAAHAALAPASGVPAAGAASPPQHPQRTPAHARGPGKQTTPPREEPTKAEEQTPPSTVETTPANPPAASEPQPPASTQPQAPATTSEPPPPPPTPPAGG